MNYLGGDIFSLSGLHSAFAHTGDGWCCGACAGILSVYPANSRDRAGVGEA
jgi:hypothetical protein